MNDSQQNGDLPSPSEQAFILRQAASLCGEEHSKVAKFLLKIASIIDAKNDLGTWNTAEIQNALTTYPEAILDMASVICGMRMELKNKEISESNEINETTEALKEIATTISKR